MNTFSDENGAAGTAACALREAITAINNGADFGGCVFTAGDSLVDLAFGTYELSLDVGSDDRVEITVPMTIRGVGLGGTNIERTGIFDGIGLLVLGTGGSVVIEQLGMRGFSRRAIHWIADDPETLTVRDVLFFHNDGMGTLRVQPQGGGILTLQRVMFHTNHNLGTLVVGRWLAADSEFRLPPS